jgi:hypothetical protein
MPSKLNPMLPLHGGNLGVIRCDGYAGDRVRALKCRHDLIVPRTLDLKAHPFFLVRSDHGVVPSGADHLTILTFLSVLIQDTSYWSRLQVFPRLPAPWGKHRKRQGGKRSGVAKRYTAWWAPLEPGGISKAVMSEYKVKLDELKKTLMKAADFSSVYHFFFDNIASDREFIDLGKPSKSNLLESALKVIDKGIFNKKCSVASLQLLKIRKESFIHGGCLLNGCIATVVYFYDIEMGMIAVNTVPGTDQMSYAFRMNGWKGEIFILIFNDC